jgi:hypothetical protein
MLPVRIDSIRASEIPAPRDFLEGTSHPQTVVDDGSTIQREGSARIGAALIICSLPFLAVWLVIRFIWQDLKAIIRGLRLFYRAVAEELSRQK